MGSGNLAGGSNVGGPANSSLPLKGSGNILHRWARPHLPGASLPRMGSGNQGFCNYHAQLIQLITPHGEWEQENGTQGGDQGQLITPHGEWERTKFPAAGPGRHSHITPHGEWELRIGLRPVLAFRNSLPLMGSGNAVCIVRFPEPVNLITPHGEWKPSRGSSCGIAH